jgi:hypothetical protein
MSDVKYSLTTLLNDLLRLQNNGYQIITKLSDVVSSNSDVVEIDIVDNNGVVQSVLVPSFGSIKNQLVRLENDIKNLSGIGDTDAAIQLSDGTFRKILISNLQKEAADIKSMAVPTEFATRENWFFESFLNPLLYITFDLTNQIKFNTENVEMSRYILNLDTDDKIRIYKDTFANKSDVKFQNFVKVLLDNNITYFLDKDIVQLPPRSLRYWGNFTVMNVFDDTLTETINSVNYQKRVLRVQLDKLQFNDRNSEFLGTQSLKIGNSLVVNSGRKNTRYEIVGVENSTRTVSLRLIEGFDLITIGQNALFYYDEDESSVSVNINVGFNEYCVIFVKPIDPDSKIASVNWSPGVGLYTNDLTIRDENDQIITLSQYYQNQVVDFGAYIYSMAKEKITPAAFGIEPDSPIINAEDFQVLQINQHLTQSSALTDLKKLQDDKLRVQSTLNTLDRSISDLRAKIQTTRYSSAKLEDTDRSELSRLIDEKSTQSSLFASIIDDINKIATSESIENLTPKYRVRGFFPMPEPKTSERTGEQAVVQFAIQYRYIKKDGSANQPQQIAFKDNNGAQRRGTFSTWVETKSDVRKRVTDPKTGQMSWAVEDVESADTININQIDIPIQQGEGIQFRIKSLSEAGWPTSPSESQWSEIIQKDFPAELESIPDANSIIEEAKKQQVLVQLQQSLTTLGVEKHVSTSFTVGNKYYTHNSIEIASGFLTSEQSIISLFDKLVSMDSQILQLRALIENSKGILNVRVVDELGNEKDVVPNTVIKIFAGNYRDQVSSLTIKKGVIVTRNYFIKMANSAASNLEMYARFWGDKYSPTQPSYVGATGYNSNDTDYNKIRRYDYVPMALSNPLSTDVSSYGFIRNFPEQSSQVLGQFIQSRYLSVDGKTPLYGPVEGLAGIPQVWNATTYITGSGVTFAIVTEDLEYYFNSSYTGNGLGSTAAGDFIWKGSTTPTTQIEVSPYNDPNVTLNYTDYIMVHVLHPDIPYWITGGPALSSPNDIAQDSIRNSIYGNQPKGATGSLWQTPLFFEGGITPTGTTSGTKYSKIGFEANDQYLLGPKSVGAYLFLNPSDSSDIRVNGNDSLSFKTVSFGNNNAFSIPVTFQYRMTDFFGDGTVGLGYVGGDPNSNSSTNLEYTKTIGIDIYYNPLDKEKFSFDLELSARYYSKSLNGKDVPSRTFEVAIDDLNQTIKNISPNTSRDVTSNRNLTGGNTNRS